MNQTNLKNAKCTSIRTKTFLILTTSGGHGHLQAANAKCQEIQTLYPDAKIVRRDLLIDWVGRFFGSLFANMWNKAQARGSSSALEFIASSQRLFDKMMWLPIFLIALRCCLKEDIDCVINTQPICTSAILKALRMIYFLKNKKIEMELVITDLPTKEATHFFHPIKKLSKKDRLFLKIVTTTPLLTDNESEQSFWQNYCSASKDEVTYTRLPVRASFLKYMDDNKANEPLTLRIKTTSEKEVSLIEKITRHGNFNISAFDHEIHFTISPSDKVAIIMLGAHPHKEAILEYCKEFISIIQSKHYKNRRDILFVLTGDGSSLKYPLQEKILELIKETKNYPKTLTIIPLTQQGETIIAPLFHRSDATFTRSGGLTSMELLCVCRGKIWIHKGKPSENLPSFFLNRKTLQGGMPPWERGNARYLEAKKGARLISPETFKEVCQSYFPEESDSLV